MFVVTVGGGMTATVLRRKTDTLTAASKVDASLGCLASDCELDLVYLK